MTLRALMGPLLICLALAAAAANAQAGQYHVYACRMPSGEPAPADGWAPTAIGPSSFAEDTCQQPGGALVAALGDTARTANSGIATWAFEAPGGESISSETLWRAGDADGGAMIDADYESWFAGPNNPDPPTPEDAFGQCESGLGCPIGVGNFGAFQSAENRLVVPVANLGSHLYVNAACVGKTGLSCKEGEHDPNGYAARVDLYAADAVLEQSTGPTAGNVGGELASAPVVRGASDVTFTASDPGSGVYEALFNVDGNVVQSTVVNDNGGRCRNVGQTTDGLPAFVYVRPCLASVSADVPFESTRVGNGSHHLIVSVVDAAGNAASVLDREITVSNPGAPGPPNGTNASAQATLSVSWKGAKGGRITRAYGGSETLDGRLTGPGGVPITRAVIDLVATPAYAGSKPVTMTGPRTGADGRFSVRLKGGISSRTLRFSYRPNLGEVAPVATRTLELAVRAGIALSVVPHTASVGRSIFFRGRLLGGPIPAGGKQLVLEARSPGGPWIEFDVISTDARGRYHASYRFKFPGPAEYQFRVRSEHESDFPFAAGSSNVVGVHEH
jgi:hypothetical protein